MKFFIALVLSAFFASTQGFTNSWVENGAESARLHNVHRAKHQNTNDLTANVRLAADARDCAKRMLDQNLNPANHPCLGDSSTQGENIYVYYSNSARGQLIKRAIDKWYDEIKDVHPSVNTEAWFMTVNTQLNIRHFFQVVWASTTHVGCGGAANGSKTYVVCRYSPKGNRLTGAALRDNVKPLKSVTTQCKPDMDYCTYITKADCSSSYGALYRADCPNLCSTC